MDMLSIKVQFAALDKITLPLRSITKQSSEAAKALKQAKDQLKELNDQQAKLDTFKTTLNRAREAKKAMSAASDAIGEATEKLLEQRVYQQELAGKVRVARKSYQDLRDAVLKLPSPPAHILKNLALQKAELEKLESAYGKSQNAMRRHREEVALHKREYQIARVAKERLSESLRYQSEKLNEAGLSTENLAKQQAELKSKIDASTASVTQQSESLGKLNDKIGKQKALLAMAGKIGAYGAKGMAAGAAVGAAGAIPVNAYAQAEDAATQLKIALMGVGGKVAPEFKAINDLAEKLGNRLPGTTADFQNMMTQLVRQGMPAKALLGGLGEATALLAVQLKMVPSAAAEFAAKLQDATRTADKDMIGLMDVIQRTFYLGVDQNNMLQAFGSLSSAMDVLNKKGLEGANALAPLVVMLDQSALVGESAGNALRKIFQRSIDLKHIKKANKELAELGAGFKLDFSNGKGEFGGMEKLFQEMDKLKKLNPQQRGAVIKELYGDDDEVMKAVSSMLEKGMAGYREVQEKMAKQADLQTRVNTQLKTLKNLWDAASGTFTNALVALGESVSPELHATAEWLGKVAERTQAWAKENPRLAAGLMTVAKWSALLLTGLGAVAVATAGVMSAWAFVSLHLPKFGAGLMWLAKGALGAVWRALAALATLAMAHPILALVTVLAGAALYIWRNWDTLGPKFHALMDRIGGYFGGLKDRAWAAGSEMIHGLMDGISTRWEGLKQRVTGTADRVVGWFKERLGIKSPSRVFMELGGFTMAGLEQGLMSNQSGPAQAVTDMTKRLAGIGAGITLGAGAAWANLPAPPGFPNLTTQIQQRVLAEHLAPPAMAQPDAARRLISDVHQPIELPPVPDAIRTIQQRVLADKYGAAPRVIESSSRSGLASLSSRGPVSIDAPMQVEIHIHGHAGQDVAAIRREVEAALKNAQQQHAARIRGRMTDLD